MSYELENVTSDYKIENILTLKSDPVQLRTY